MVGSSRRRGSLNNQRARGSTNNENETRETSDSRQPKTFISPSGIWFTSKVVKDAVSDAIKSKTNVCCPNWKETPAHVKVDFWNHFKNNFEYDPAHEAELRKTFYKKAGLRLKDLVWHVKTEEDGAWMSQAARDALLLRKSTEAFKKKSAQTSANRTKHKINGKVMGTHNMGRKSALEKAAEMAKNAGGKMPTAFELFKQVHTPKGKETVETGRPKDVMESFTNEIAELDAQGISYTEDEVYYKSAGGKKKGQVFGVGNAQSLYYGPSASPTAASAQSYTPGVLTQLQTHHEQLLKEAVDKVNQENEERLQKMNQENEERLSQMQSQIELEMMRKFEERFALLSSTRQNDSTTRSRDPHEDGGRTSSSFEADA